MLACALLLNRFLLLMPRTTALVALLYFVGLFLPSAGLVATAQAQTTSPPAPSLTLRSLAAALRERRAEDAGRLVLTLLAWMAREKERGISQSESLAASYREERLSGVESVPVQRCLLTNWNLAVGFNLFTPANLGAMERGEAPVIARGPHRGRRAVLRGATADPAGELTLTLAPAEPGDSAQAIVSMPTPAVAAATPAPRGAQVYEDKQVYALKKLDLRIGERVNLNDYGLWNYDLRLDRVENDKRVTFLIEDRTVQHYKTVTKWVPAENRYRSDRERTDDAAKTVSFLPQKIPGSDRMGVKLGIFGFVSIYLDADVVAASSYRLYFRFPEEMLNLAGMTPEKRKYYEYSPPGLHKVNPPGDPAATPAVNRPPVRDGSGR